MTIKEQIKEFIAFETETSGVYPWATENVTYAQLNKADAEIRSYGYTEHMLVDTEVIYTVLNHVLGINPVLMS